MVAEICERPVERPAHMMDEARELVSMGALEFGKAYEGGIEAAHRFNAGNGQTAARRPMRRPHRSESNGLPTEAVILLGRPGYLPSRSVNEIMQRAQQARKHRVQLQ